MQALARMRHQRRSFLDITTDIRNRKWAAVKIQQFYRYKSSIAVNKLRWRCVMNCEQPTAEPLPCV